MFDFLIMFPSLFYFFIFLFLCFFIINFLYLPYLIFSFFHFFIFFLFSGGVVAPSFNVPEDKIAFEILKECFPDRKVVQIYARDILLGGGNIHCITQQIPEP